MTLDAPRPAAVLPLRGLSAMAVVWGPGLLVMLADTDVGNIVTAAQSGTEWGYRLLPLPLLLIVPLYMIQELAVRLGLFTGQGFGALVRTHYGVFWGWAAGSALVLTALGSIVTELVGIAGVGEMYGVPRWLLLPLAASGLLLIVLSGRYRRVERIAVVIGLFELSFLVMAYTAHPHLADIGHDLTHHDYTESHSLYLSAALIGATFNPWMIFYQSSALAEKQIGPEHYTAARWDTAIGATLTQILTASVIIAAAATLGLHTAGAPITGVGEISEAMTPLLGGFTGRLVFGAGVVGAAVVAAIVCSLALAWGLAEAAGCGRGGNDTLRRRWFLISYGTGVVGATVLVLLVPDLIWLTIAMQVINALLMPLVVGLLVVLAARHLPPTARLRGWYLYAVAGTVAVICATGLIGALAGTS